MTNYHLRPLRFFGPLGPLLERYFAEVVRAAGETLEAELWMEAEERVAQLDFLIDRVSALQDQALAIGQQQLALSQELLKYRGDKKRLFSSAEYLESNRLASLHTDVMFELKLSAEAFYYFAGRLIGMLQRFPQFKRFDSPGIRSVRNDLIEHADKTTSGITQQNWGFSKDTGPALKNIRRSGQRDVPLDRGMFVNAAELRDRLIRRLEDLLSVVT